MSEGGVTGAAVSGWANTSEALAELELAERELALGDRRRR